MSANNAVMLITGDVLYVEKGLGAEGCILIMNIVVFLYRVCLEQDFSVSIH